MKILIVDDEHVALTSVKRLLKHQGIRDVDMCNNGKDAINQIENNNYDVVLLDLLMPDVDGLQVLETVKPFKPRTEFILLTAIDDISNAVKAIRLGAYDYLVKPVENERLFLTIDRAYERRAMRAGLVGTPSHLEKGSISEAFSAIISQSSRMQEVVHYADMMAQTESPILITGESGTGKELMARGIHQAGQRAAGPFIAVNVCSVAESMFESQFFGYTRGAFTGATNDFPGFFEQAHGGTLFLDEIGDLPMNLQAKLLRVFEEKTVTRLGDPKPVGVDVRILSATNTDLDKTCREGQFRLDLLYRLKAAHVHIPPLSERVNDIPLLANYFLQKSCESHHKDIQSFSTEAMEILSRKNFPGNVRQLAQFIDNVVLRANEDSILPHHLGEKTTELSPFTQNLCTFQENSEKHLLYVLSQTQNNKKQAAEILGVTVRQVQRKLSQMKNNSRWQSISNDI